MGKKNTCFRLATHGQAKNEVSLTEILTSLIKFMNVSLAKQGRISLYCPYRTLPLSQQWSCRKVYQCVTVLYFIIASLKSNIDCVQTIIWAFELAFVYLLNKNLTKWNWAVQLEGMLCWITLMCCSPASILKYCWAIKDCKYESYTLLYMALVWWGASHNTAVCYRNRGQHLVNNRRLESVACKDESIWSKLSKEYFSALCFIVATEK